MATLNTIFKTYGQPVIDKTLSSVKTQANQSIANIFKTLKEQSINSVAKAPIAQEYAAEQKAIEIKKAAPWLIAGAVGLLLIGWYIKD